VRQLFLGDCLEVLKGLPDNSVDSVVTDPPYGLSFMGKRWDYDVPSEDIWRECLRVLKPGGHLLAFAGTRTQHRMAVRIEDAGFEIRDMIAWVYGSGFPKSLDVSKAIDKAAGVEREVVGINEDYLRRKPNGMKTAGATAYGYSQTQQETDARITAPATDAAKQWQGWGSALKPALEPITLARKPFKGTIAKNVLTHGTGALNVDGCRVSGSDAHAAVRRWPANLIHDGSDEVTELFPFSQSRKQSGERGTRPGGFGDVGASRGSKKPNGPQYDDKGSAARFFYCAKASKADRGLPNNHPTVKPIELMRYLCRLVTPQGGTVLDPFMGSGTTGKAALLECFAFIGIERDSDYFAIAKDRVGK
jgi:DNA modification methylase